MVYFCMLITYQGLVVIIILKIYLLYTCILPVFGVQLKPERCINEKQDFTVMKNVLFFNNNMQTFNT